MKVRELMSQNTVSLAPDNSVMDAAEALARHHIGMIPVCAPDGRVRGIVTDRDIVLRCLACESAPESTRLREIMSRGVISVTSDADVREAAQTMASEQIRRLPVIDGGRLVGVLSLGDLARCVRFDMEASKALSRISAR